MQKVIFGWLFLCLFFSCQNTGKKMAAHEEKLDGTSWVLFSMPGQELGNTKVSLQFQGNKINGKAVCNRYFSDYRTEQSSIEIGNIGGTKMMCPDQATLETEYFDALAKVKDYELTQKQLRLKTEIGVLVFERTDEI